MRASLSKRCTACVPTGRRCSGLVAAITIMVGNWAAVTQENSKRLLAYSSISNAGYLLLGLVAGNSYGYIGLVIYLLVYTLMNMGAFGIIISLRRRGIIGDNVDDLTGLAHKAPGMAAMMAIFMLSLGGLPMTGGFIGKYFLFGGLLQRGKADGKNVVLLAGRSGRSSTPSSRSTTTCASSR